MRAHRHQLPEGAGKLINMLQSMRLDPRRVWVPLHSVFVDGIEGAGDSPDGWTTVAVLRASPVAAAFRIAFSSNGIQQRLVTPLAPPDGVFGMRIGPGDVLFQALPVGSYEVVLELVELVSIDDPFYGNLPLY